MMPVVFDYVFLTLGVILVLGWIFEKIDNEKQMEIVLQSNSKMYSRQLENSFEGLSYDAAIIADMAVSGSDEDLKKAIDKMFSSEVSILSVEVYGEKGLVMNINIIENILQRISPGDVPIGPLMRDNVLPANRSYSASWVRYEPFDGRGLIRFSFPGRGEQGRFEVRLVVDLQFLQVNFPLSKSSRWSMAIIEDTGRVIHSVYGSARGDFLGRADLCDPSISYCWPWQKHIISDDRVTTYVPWSVITISSRPMWRILALFNIVALLVMFARIVYPLYKKAVCVDVINDRRVQ